MSGKSYLYEKLLSAIGTMATSPRTLQDRLRTAALTCIAVKEDDLPEGELRDKWNEVQQRLTSVEPTGDEGSLEATLSRMSDEEAHDVAELFWELFSELGDLATLQLPHLR